jgi:membrane protein implicated in regulation of membrane protease activity
MLNSLITGQRYIIFLACGVIALAALAGAVFYSPWLLVLAALASALFLLGLRDLRQRRHSILRNYPVPARKLPPGNPPVHDRERS